MAEDPAALRRFTLKQDGKLASLDGHKTDEDCKFLRNILASAHLNMMLGSAFSIGVVPTLEMRESWFCAVESKISGCQDEPVWGDALRMLKAEYFRSVMLPLDGEDPTDGQVAAIKAFLGLVRDRGTTTIPKRINLFTTNYDPLIERSLEKALVSYNDGFVGREHPVFDSSAYSRLQYEQSLFMEYTSQVVTANVMKPHGSLTWRRAENAVEYSSADETLKTCLDGCEGIVDLPVLDGVRKLVRHECDDRGLAQLEDAARVLSPADAALLARFGDRYDSTLCIVNPTKRKFEETLLERSYYDLLRIYANELDRNNALLLVFGFSFADEHIRDLTVRAAKSNPKLIVLISCYSTDAAGDFERLFKGCENVILLVPEDGECLGLDVFAKGLAWLSR